nr:hypothetical protein CFP56_12490 [Quercus suber]
MGNMSWQEPQLLWLLEDLFHVLTKNTATEAIKAIVINRYQWDRGDWTFEAPFYEWEVPHWNFEVIPEAFSKMGVKYLDNIYNIEPLPPGTPSWKN